MQCINTQAHEQAHSRCSTCSSTSPPYRLSIRVAKLQSWEAASKNPERLLLPPPALANTTPHQSINWHQQATRGKCIRPSLLFIYPKSQHALHCRCRTSGNRDILQLSQIACWLRPQASQLPPQATPPLVKLDVLRCKRPQLRPSPNFCNFSTHSTV